MDIEYIKNRLYFIFDELNIEVGENGYFDAESIEIIQLIVLIEECFNIQFPIDLLDFDKLKSFEYYIGIVCELV